MVVWGKTADAYVLPSIKLTVAGTGWLSGAAVGSWTIDRELVASTIPGNIRERNGLSIGAGSVGVRPVVRASPWSKKATARVVTGVAASLYAQAPDGTTKNLGAWLTDETDGSLSSEEISIDLLEAQYAGRNLPQALPAYGSTPFTANMPVDPAWIIGRLLEQAGFSSVPIIPSPSFPAAAPPVLAVPMDGAIHGSGTGGYAVTGTVATSWQSLPDRTIGGGSGTKIAAVSAGTAPISDALRAGNAVYFTLNVVGTVWLVDALQGWVVRITRSEITNPPTWGVSVSNALGTMSTERTIQDDSSVEWPYRASVRVARTWDAANSRWSSIQAQLTANSSGSIITATASDSTVHTPAGGLFSETIQVAGGVAIAGTPVTSAAGQFSGMLATLYNNTGAWVPAKAVLKPLGGDVGLPFVPDGIDVWEAIQDVASASLAAVIVDLDGMARVLTRNDLAGAGVTAATVDVGAEWEDLDWTLDPEDTADRLEVSFTPPAITEANIGATTLAPVAWAASEVIEIGAGATITLPVTFEGKAAVGVFRGFWLPTGSPDANWSQWSTILAFDNPEGTGSPLGPSQIFAQAVQTSATTATVTVLNRTSGTIYLVDGNGDPCLFVRARTVATYDTPRTVARGAAADVAKRPLQVDLTPWVQTEAHATTIANYLWDRISGAGLWKASSVRCRLDWSLDIGQVRSLAHSRTGLDAKVLIAKVHFDGSDDQIAQSLDLVLIPWTYADFAAKWPTQTYAQFATAQGARTYADHEADPLWTGA